MRMCPYCNAGLDDHDTFCQVCGYTFVLSLPYPVFPRRRFYLSLSILSIFSGILSCAFTFVPSLYMASIPFVIGAIGLAGVTLERSRGKLHILPIKILAVLGLFFGVLGYLSFMFIRSNVPGIGYSM